VAPYVSMVVLMALMVSVHKLHVWLSLGVRCHCCYGALSARCSVVWSGAQVLPLQTMRTCTSAADD
jgi:prepilin signal peptidase PulO-like enzyme (type II secretory pathway)